MATPTVCFTFDHLGDLGPFFGLLEKHGLTGTFFVQGELAARDPGAAAEIVRRGHHVGMHGWAHEAWADLGADEERELALRATAAIADATGTQPEGFRAPEGSRSEHTAGLLTDLGYRYDASLGEAMTPAVLEGGVAQVPFVWDGVDGAYYLRPDPADPAEVRERWLGAIGDDLFVPICHPEITGSSDERLAVLDEVMATALADERVRVCTVAEVADEVLA